MTDAYAYAYADEDTAATADVESALDGLSDAGRAAAAAVAAHLEGANTFALDEVDEVTVDYLHGWVVTGEVGSLPDPRARWRCRPGLRTFVVTPALDRDHAPTHRVEQSLTGGHTHVVEEVTDSYRRAVAVIAAEPAAYRVARTVTDPASLREHPQTVQVGQEVTLLRYGAHRRGIVAHLSPTGRRAVVVFVTPTSRAVHQAELSLTRLYV